MSRGVVKKAPKKRGANSYKLPEPISAGEILTDLTKNQWILGTSIGVGGFGEIYSAAPCKDKTPKDYPNVIKIEPHENGPLFVEMHFYMRNGKPSDIDAWKKKKKLSTLGMPCYIGSGSHEYKNVKYRFVVMDRYGTDLMKLFRENNKHFPEHTVYKVALQIINILEYIHFKTYVHADIKGANLLLDLKNQDQVYLVDFGLASRYTTQTEYKLDPKKAHNGTIEYTSRDAHMGIPTMRGDFEILGYNMIHWISGSLLWEKDLSNPVTVQKQKEKAFEDIPEFLNKSFHGPVPNTILKYMTLLANMKFNETPDYEKFKAILVNGLKQLSHKPDGKLEFTSHVNNHMAPPSKTTPQKAKKPVEKTRQSPRVKATKVPSPVRSLDDSNIGIVMDKRRGGIKDIKKILDDIESDEEYDIKIVKKAKKPTETVPISVSKDYKKSVRSRKKVQVNNRKESISDSESVVVTKGTRSRPAARKATLRSPKTRKAALAIHESTSDEDIFDM